MCVELQHRCLTEPLQETDYAVLSVQERDFAQTLRYAQVRQQYIQVRVAVRQILAAYLHEPAQKIRFAKGEYGKPYLLDYPAVQFSLSHSGVQLMLAISTVGMVGVDIEDVQKSRTALTGLVEKCFAPAEIAYWNTLDSTQQLLEFYRFWTSKEAFVKAVGRGIAVGLAHCVVTTEGNPAFVRIPAEYGCPQDWRLFNFSAEPHFIGALVVETRDLPNTFCLPNFVQNLSGCYTR